MTLSICNHSPGGSCVGKLCKSIQDGDLGYCAGVRAFACTFLNPYRLVGQVENGASHINEYDDDF